MSTISNQVSFDDAEDFRLPSDGVHNGFFQRAEFGPNKAGTRNQFTISVVLHPDDPDAPNLPMRTYLSWPTEDDKEVMWGSRTAYGAKIKALKDLNTALGGQESGNTNLDKLIAFYNKKEGTPIKIKTKQSNRQAKNEATGKYEDIDPPELQANVTGILPA